MAASYTVTFKNWDGTVLDTQTITSGSDATPPIPAPTRDGYDFAGWDESYINITSNVTLTAQYDEMTVSLYNFLNWDDPMFDQPDEVKTSDSVIDYNTTHVQLSSSIDNTGTSEVSSSFLTDINNAISSDKILVVPEGTYLIKSLSIPANAKIHFCEGSLIKHDIAESDADRCIILDNENITITGRLTVDGCWENQTLGSEHIHNVAVFDASNSSIESVWSYNSAADCLYLSGNDGNSAFPTGIRVGYAKCTKAKRKLLTFEHVDDCVVDVAILDNTEGSSTGQGGHCIDVEPYNYDGTYTANNTVKYCYTIGSGNDFGGSIREKGRNYVFNINTLVADVLPLHTAYEDDNAHEFMSAAYSLGSKVIVGNAKINLATSTHPDWTDSDGKRNYPSIVNALFGAAFRFGSIVVKGGVSDSSLFNLCYSSYDGLGGAPVCVVDYLKISDCNCSYIVCSDRSNFTLHNYMLENTMEQSTTRYGTAGTLIFGLESEYVENIEEEIAAISSFDKVYLGDIFIKRIYYGLKLIKYNLPTYVKSITLNSTSVDLYIDDTFQLQATVLPANATVTTLSYSTSNDTVCTVSDTGLITAIGIGDCNITVQATDGSGVTATCAVTVAEASTGGGNLFNINGTLNYTEAGGTVSDTYVPIVDSENNSMTINACTASAPAVVGQKISLKANTTYTMIYTIVGSVQINGYVAQGQDNYLVADRYESNTTRARSFTTGSSDVDVCYGFLSVGSTPGVVKDVMLLEGDYENDIPDFIPYA